MREKAIAIGAILSIALYLGSYLFLPRTSFTSEIILCLFLVISGGLLTFELLQKALRKEFGSDLLAGFSIVTSVLLGEYLAGVIVVLMLSSGQILEQFALYRASMVLEALAKRMPNRAHRKTNGKITDIGIEEISPGDQCIVFPHEICPVDGIVIEGRGTMDESYLTGEPFLISKTLGMKVLSGAINGATAITIKATRRSEDSRYAKIMQVMNSSQQQRPRLRRLGDQLGAWYTPLALGIAVLAWLISGDPQRFLSVIVIATPCPLLIGIPVAIIGAISLSAQRGIIIKDPAILEQLNQCRTMILDKTGTLTYGKPQLRTIYPLNGFSEEEILFSAASLERYSKHPLAQAILEKAGPSRLQEAEEISEEPGQGLKGKVGGKVIFITGRRAWLEMHPEDKDLLSIAPRGLECVVSIGGKLSGLMQFHDKPRIEGKSFIDHLMPMHKFKKIMIVSGDQEREVRYLADEMGIKQIYAGQSPEQKVEIVRKETRAEKTVYIGDGINDAPALLTATVGIAFGQNSEITSEASGAVIMESSLRKVDELFHISRYMRRIALQSALGGMALSIVGMLAASFGLITPVAGAIAQELIDLFAVLNALRVIFMRDKLSDFK